jgi:phage-related holin
VDLEKFYTRIVEGWQFNTTAGLLFAWLFGGYTDVLRALAILFVLDWLTKMAALSVHAGGFWVAWKTDVISSEGMRRGVKKFVWYGLAVLVGHQVSYVQIAGYGLGNASTEFVCGVLIFIEAKSVLENLRDMGWKDAGILVAMLGRKQDQITSGGQVGYMPTAARSNFPQPGGENK